MNENWSDNIEDILIKIRLSSLIRSKYHKESYFRMNSLLKYFRIPIIILSALLSVFSMSTFELQKYVCSFMSLLISIISSIELFLQIQKRMEIDLFNSRAFYSLASDITKILNLVKENRKVNGIKYLDDKANEYKSLVDLSIISDLKLYDKLLSINLLGKLSDNRQLKLLISNENELKLLINNLKNSISLINDIETNDNPEEVNLITYNTQNNN